MFEFIKNIFENALSGDLLAIAVLILFVVTIFSLIRFTIKISVIVIIVFLIAVLFFGFKTDTFISKGKEVIEQADTYVIESVQNIAKEELKNADFVDNKDGSYTIKTTSLSIKGNQNNSILVVNFKGTEYSFDVAKLTPDIQSQIQNLIQQSQ